jgi:hypothetical protein
VGKFLLLFPSSSEEDDSFENRERRIPRVLQTDITTTTISTKIQKLQASNGGMDHFFGDERGVAISSKRIIVGARGTDDAKGAAYLFKKLNESYSQMAIILASDGHAGDLVDGDPLGDWFGSSVDIDGDWIAVGAQERSNSTGAIYVYRITLNQNEPVTQLSIITASNGDT